MKDRLSKIGETIKKYKYALLVLLIGLFLMVMPDFKHDIDSLEHENVEEAAAEPSLEDKLEMILAHVDGAGHVKVILTIRSGEEVVYQTDDENVTGDSSSIKFNTVTVTDAERNQSGLIRQIHSAVYQGAIVVCDGAENSAVRLAIVDAVSKITGLGSNKISVLKMKH